MTESKINIVDEDNHLLGVKPRSEIDYAVDRYQCTGLFITNRQGQVLIAQRSFKKDKDPGVWGPAVAGTVDEGETFLSNIYKEAEEEIGLREMVFTTGPLYKSEYPRKHYCQWFFARVDLPLAAFTRQEEEVEQLAWVEVEELKAKVLKNPENYVISFARHLTELLEFAQSKF